MMSKKGQALVEFVLVFPIFLMIICTIIELGSINYQKYKLEDNLNTIVNMYLHDSEEITDYANDNSVKMNIKTEENKITIELNKRVNIVTPVLKAIYKNNYNLTTERVFYDE